jgi:hypothetical protein
MSLENNRLPLAGGAWGTANSLMASRSVPGIGSVARRGDALSPSTPHAPTLDVAAFCDRPDEVWPLVLLPNAR